MPDGSLVEHGTYVDLQKTSDATLRISLTDEGRRALDEFEQIRDPRGIDAAIRELLEDHLCGVWEEVFPEEIGALTAGLLATDSPPAGTTHLTDWARENGEGLGRRYSSELARRRDRTSTYARL